MLSVLVKVMRMVVVMSVALTLVGASHVQSLSEVMKRRGLRERDLFAAAKTFNPSGKKDEYLVLFLLEDSQDM